MHKFEWQDGLLGKVDALCEIDETIMFLVHPRTEKNLKKYNLYEKLKTHIKVIKPIGYFDFLKLINHSERILTDSGGIQKEAYILKIPCITLRENTEWVETLEDGWNVLAGTNKMEIANAIKEPEPKTAHTEIFGEGDACKKIGGILKDFDR